MSEGLETPRNIEVAVASTEAEMGTTWTTTNSAQPAAQFDSAEMPAVPLEGDEPTEGPVPVPIQEIVPEDGYVPALGDIVIYEVIRGADAFQLTHNGATRLPAIVVNVGSGDGAVNLKVFCDEHHDAWKQRVVRGVEPGTWRRK